MTVANVILFEFDTPEDLQKWADWARTGAGVFPENQILLFVKTGETSAIGIATYPNEEAREMATKLRDQSRKIFSESWVVRDVVPLSGQVLVEFIGGILSK